MVSVWLVGAVLVLVRVEVVVDHKAEMGLEGHTDKGLGLVVKEGHTGTVLVLVLALVVAMDYS